MKKLVKLSLTLKKFVLFPYKIFPILHSTYFMIVVLKTKFILMNVVFLSYVQTPK